MLPLAVQLLQAAVDGFDSSGPAPQQSELACEHCSAVLFQPVTLGDGRTVCKPCVRKVASRLNGEVQAGFGGSTNTVLDALSQACLPGGHSAAAERQEGNRLFVAKEFEAAAAAYSKAVALAPSDIVPQCNLSAALLALGNTAGAAEAALHALRNSASLHGHTHPMRQKALYRLASAMLAGNAPVADADAAAKALLAAALAAGASDEAERTDEKSAVRKLLQRAVDALAGSAPPDDAIRLRLLKLLESGAALDELVGEAPPGGAATPTRLDGSALADTTVREQLDCPLCVELLHEPAALPCGHVMCRACLARTLDQAWDQPPRCPMCRTEHGPFLTWINSRAAARAGPRRSGVASGDHGASQMAVCAELQRLLQTHLPVEARARAEHVSAQEADRSGDELHPVVPVFVCSLALPGVRCPLHVFEPRYRLMMRRCIDSGRREFGMVAATSEQVLNYGTMLRIERFEQLPDGRSSLDTIGTRRFKVLEWGERDGYATAKLEWIVDNDAPLSTAALTADVSTGAAAAAAPAAAPAAAAVDPEQQERLKQAEMQENVTRLLRQSLVGSLYALPALRRAQIESQIGAVPQDDVELPFWCVVFAQQRDLSMHYEVAFGDRTRHSHQERVDRAAAVWFKLLQDAEERRERRAPAEHGDGARDE